MALSLDELRDLAKELDVDLDPAPYRMTNKPAPAASLNIVTAIIGEHDEHTASTQTDSTRIREIRRQAETGAVSAHELRDQLRAIGVDMGHQREDAADRLDTVRHEAGHAAAALALGWGVKWVDVGAAVTQVEQPSYANRSALDMDAERATIFAAGAVFTGKNSRHRDLEGDRFLTRHHCRTRWEDARAEAELMAKDRRVKSLHRALTDALLASPSGRLEGDSLRAVIAEWEG